MYDAYTTAEPALLADGPAHHVGREEHRQQPARADRAVRGHGRRRRPTSSCSWPRAAASANKSLPVPGDQGDPEPGLDDAVPRGEDPLARHRGLPAVPPRDRRRRHVAPSSRSRRPSTRRALPRRRCPPRARSPAAASATTSSRSRSSSSPRRSASARSSAASTSATTSASIRLPRHGASLPVAIAVSCSADRQAKAKITAEGVFLEQLEFDPAGSCPRSPTPARADTDGISGTGKGAAVKIDLTRPMAGDPAPSCPSTRSRPGCR